MTKIDIISGFLGAGKTTLIKKLIAEAFAGEKLVLIENEFGEIGIDGGFLKEAGIEITEMNSGCICCSLVGDFGTALKEVLQKFQPDRVLIEPSGVGKLSDVIRAVQGVAEEVEIQLNSFVAVVDAVKGKMYMKNFGEFFNNQIESANTIVLSRTQNLSQDKLETVVGLLRDHNEKTAIITTPWDQLTGGQILGAMEKAHSLAEEMLMELHEEECDAPDCECHHHGHEHHHHDHDCDCHEHHHHDHGCDCHEHHHHHHHADEVFQSWGVETPHKYEKSELEQILKVLSEENPYGTVLRAKGMVESPDGQWLFFDLTPGEYEVRKGSAEYTGRICVIGADLKEKELEKLFSL